MVTLTINGIEMPAHYVDLKISFKLLVEILASIADGNSEITEIIKEKLWSKPSYTSSSEAGKDAKHISRLIAEVVANKVISPNTQPQAYEYIITKCKASEDKVNKKC
jgi:hypothetical protein